MLARCTPIALAGATRSVLASMRRARAVRKESKSARGADFRRLSRFDAPRCFPFHISFWRRDERPCRGTSRRRHAEAACRGARHHADTPQGRLRRRSGSRAIDRIAPADFPAEFFRDPFDDAVSVQVRQQRDELVAAVATGKVLGPDARRDAGADGREQPVGDAVPVTVIHGLESIQIDEHERELTPPLRGIARLRVPGA